MVSVGVRVGRTALAGAILIASCTSTPAPTATPVGPTPSVPTTTASALPSPTERATTTPRPSTWIAHGLPLEWDDPIPPDPDLGPTVLDIAASATALVAVGYDARGGQVWYSTDGATWERLGDSPVWDFSHVARVVYFKGAFVAVGVDGNTDGIAHLVVWSSVDGRTWERVPDAPVFTFHTGGGRQYYGGLLGAVWVDGDQLVVEGKPACDCSEPQFVDWMRLRTTWYSGDGTNWSRTEATASTSVAFDPGPVVFVGRRYRIVNPTATDEPSGRALVEVSDGGVWRAVYTEMSGDRLVDLLVVGHQLLVVDNGGQVVRTNDGETWAADWEPYLPPTDRIVAAVAFGGGLAAVGELDQLPTAWTTEELSDQPTTAEQPAEPPGGLSMVDASWMDLPSLPVGLAGPAAVALADGRTLVFGGNLSSAAASDVVYQFDPLTGAWSELATLPAGPPFWRGAVEAGDKVYVFGDDRGSEGRLFSFDPVRLAWRELDRPPLAIRAATLGADGVIYGATPGGLLAYDPPKNRWLEPIATPVPDRVRSVAAVGSDIAVLSDVRIWWFSVLDHAWTPGTATLRVGRQPVLLGLPDGTLAVLRGGVEFDSPGCPSDPQLEPEILDRARGQWSVAPSLPSLEGFATTVSSSGAIEVIGGQQNDVFHDGVGCVFSIGLPQDSFRSLVLP